MTSLQRSEPPRLVEQFLPICPEFRPRWNEHLAYWHGEERGECTDIALFARFVVDCYSHHATERFPEIFGEVERLLAEGNAKVRKSVSIGLLQDIQTIAWNRDFGSEVFLRWLGPTSRQAWCDIAKMWEDKQSLMDVLRDERRKENGT